MPLAASQAFREKNGKVEKEPKIYTELSTTGKSGKGIQDFCVLIMKLQMLKYSEYIKSNTKF